MAGMFAGASNVNISGGSFKTINGPYHHHEHVTHQQNYDSNNVLGNNYRDMYNDNSQTNHGAQSRTRNGRTRQRTARAAPANPQAAQRQDLPESALAAKTYPALPNRAFTAPASHLLSGFAPSAQGLVKLGPGTSALLKPGDIQDLNPEAVSHFEKFFAAQFPQSRPQQGRRVEGGVDDDVAMQYGGDDDTDTEDEDEEPSARMRITSPPTGRMAQMSLGSPSFYSSQTSPLPQPQHYMPYVSPYTSLHTPPLASMSTYERASLHHAPPPPVFHAQQNQQHSYYTPPLTPAPANPNISAQAIQSHMSRVIDTLVDPSNMSTASPSPGPASRTYSNTLYDSTNPADNIPILDPPSDADTGVDSGYASGCGSNSGSFGAASPGPGREQIFNGSFTEFSHESHTTNYGLSGVVANNVVRNVFSRRADETESEESVDDEDEQEAEDQADGLGGLKKRKGRMGKQGRVTARRK